MNEVPDFSELQRPVIGQEGPEGVGGKPLSITRVGWHDQPREPLQNLSIGHPANPLEFLPPSICLRDALEVPVGRTQLHQEVPVVNPRPAGTGPMRIRASA